MRFLLSKKTTLVAGAVLTLLLPSCENGGNFTLFGYTTQPNYRTDIHTVRVKIFNNRTFRKGLEFQLTQAVIDEIKNKTPFRIVNGDGPADTELTGTINSFAKGVLVVNNVNEERQVETTLTVEFTWRDLRSGEYLSKPPRRPFEPPAETPVPPGTTVGPQPLQPPPSVPGATTITPPTLAGNTPGANNSIIVTTTADYVPEVGQSLATAMQSAVNKMAREIVQLMEKPW